MWMELFTAGLSALSKKRAADYKHELDVQQVETNNALVQASALAANSAVDTNVIRANYAAEGMKEDIEKKSIQAVSSARAFAAANNMGAGSFDSVFQSVAVQAKAQEAGVQQSLTNEFVNSDLDRANIQRSAESREMTVGSHTQSGLQTLLDFGKGSLGLLSDTDKRKITSGFGSFL
jgi:hypothetical protein